MTLSLPEDVEPYVTDYDQLTNPGVYVLQLERPSAFADAWDNEYDHRPPYWQDLIESKRVFYVGGATNLLKRLERHRDNDNPERDTKRDTALTRVCRISGLHTAWPTDSTEEAFQLERDVARTLQRSMPDSFVHQN